MGREETRLLDAYQAGVITLADLSQRRQLIAQRHQAVQEQREQQARLRQHQLQAQAVLEDLTQFCERVRSRLQAMTLAEKQALLPLLIEETVVGQDSLEIHHVIPLHTNPTPVVGSDPVNRRLRSDGTSAQRFPGDD